MDKDHWTCKIILGLKYNLQIIHLLFKSLCSIYHNQRKVTKLFILNLNLFEGKTTEGYFILTFNKKSFCSLAAEQVLVEF